MTCRSNGIDLFSRIREVLPMREVAEQYGFEVNRAGFMPCPFHSGDDTPSLKIYNGSRGWHCFGCGSGGDPVDFVRRLFSLDVRAAMVRIDTDFGLGLFNEKADPEALRRIRAERARKAQELEAFREAYDTHVEESRFLRSALRSDVNMHLLPERAGEYAAMMGRLEYLDFWFSITPWK